MSKEHDLPSDSDEDDEDYVPENAEDEPVSEAESEGEAESGPEDENNENEKVSNKKGRKRRKGAVAGKNRRRKDEVKKTVEEDEEEVKSDDKKALTEEEEKKRADSLWADFMKDTAVVPKPKPQNTSNGSKEESFPTVRPKKEDKVKITKVFEFAGEEVRVEKEIPLDSAEARLSLPTTENPARKSNPLSTSSNGSSRGRGAKRGSLSGISSVLGQLGKKAKISTLEKSKLDWDNFKKAENLEEEISTHNKGKDGYLERQDFLQRADLRQFEIEKQLRNTNRRSAR
ncbi:craniofacial development protein 1 [Orussus abietinus]|uniref:craniofacial development protein 1 n=1 Tax=Orussus abietinus TaxID=222816 RepID=UPI00062550FA|nr:craniofacial development protein 1 [Orussus abietinus]